VLQILLSSGDWPLYIVLEQIRRSNSRQSSFNGTSDSVVLVSGSFWKRFNTAEASSRYIPVDSKAFKMRSFLNELS
jgi:hypothetical protein